MQEPGQKSPTDPAAPTDATDTAVERAGAEAEAAAPEAAVPEVAETEGAELAGANTEPAASETAASEPAASEPAAGDSVAEPAVSATLARELRCRRQQVAAALDLLDRGNTVTFIARYRRDATGDLSEPQLRQLVVRRAQLEAVAARRAAARVALASREQLTPELEQKLERAADLRGLEDLLAASDPARRERTAVARSRGLEPLARLLLEQAPGGDPEADAQKFVDEAGGVPSVLDALGGAGQILAQWVADDAEVRQELRRRLAKEGKLVARPRRRDASGKGMPGKYETYYDFAESLAGIPSHRALAIERGVKEEQLESDVTLDDAKFRGWLSARYVKDAQSLWAPYVEAILSEAYENLLLPEMRAQAREQLKERADGEAIRVFQANLREMLLSPPAGRVPVLGIDPGMASGCKLAVLDATGAAVATATIHPHAGEKQDVAGATQTLGDLVTAHGVRVVAVASAPPARATQNFVRTALAERGITDVPAVVVGEAGAAVYATSAAGRHELPEHDVRTRAAASIGRRLQDPLAELVKIDPRAIGVGQYQHDVDGPRLRRALAETVESSVNHVGVDLATASASLLRQVSGLDAALAEAIVAARSERGGFSSRAALAEVGGIDEERYRQVAGFIRLRGGENPLDATAIHPESYGLVERIAAAAGVAVAELLGNAEALARVDSAALGTGARPGKFELAHVLTELREAGRDPRPEFKAPALREDVNSLEDLTEGMELEGTVTNVAAFGAFVDIGVNQDGLVHVSEISHRFARDSQSAVKVGQVVRVKVVSLDKERRRIGLSMKALVPPPEAPPLRRREPRAAAATGAEGAAAGAGAPGPRGPRAPKRERPPRRPSRPALTEAQAAEAAEHAATGQPSAAHAAAMAAVRAPRPSRDARDAREVRPGQPGREGDRSGSPPKRDARRPGQQGDRPGAPGRDRGPSERRPRPDGEQRRERAPKEQQFGPPPAPAVEAPITGRDLTLEEKIRLLKGKFSPTR